jgi:predicted site-specific integrase-resolvase
MTQESKKSKYITLQEWAEAMFSKVPHYNTLLRWVHDGRIQPQPEKIGRCWQVKRDAVYMAD